MIDNAASHDWVERQTPRLLLYARVWVRRVADAEDVVQEAWLSYWSQPPGAIRAPLAWLHQRVRSLAIDRGRSEGRRVRREQAVATSEAEPSHFTDDLEQREWQKQVDEALGELPDEQREVLVLKIWSGLTLAEIADVTGVPANTAASRYRYALQALQARFAGRE